MYLQCTKPAAAPCFQIFAPGNGGTSSSSCQNWGAIMNSWPWAVYEQKRHWGNGLGVLWKWISKILETMVRSSLLKIWNLWIVQVSGPTFLFWKIKVQSFSRSRNLDSIPNHETLMRSTADMKHTSLTKKFLTRKKSKKRAIFFVAVLKGRIPWEVLGVILQPSTASGESYFFTSLSWHWRPWDFRMAGRSSRMEESFDGTNGVPVMLGRCCFFFGTQRISVGKKIGGMKSDPVIIGIIY